MSQINPKRVLLVEDDPLLREEILLHLSSFDFEVEGVNSGSALTDAIAHEPANLFVIDVNLPGESGIHIAGRVRKNQPDAAIVIMTARSSMADKIAGYRQGGADFYLTKPFAPTELLLVLQGLSNRLENRQQEHAWQLSLRDRSLKMPANGVKFRLTAKEKALILALTQAPNNTLTSGELCNLFTGTDGLMISKHALEELITRMRRKLRSNGDPGAENIIQSVWGVGYQLCATIAMID
jgi:DNA-binding response OmpR family regulator